MREQYLWESPVPLSVSYEEIPFPLDAFPCWCSKYVEEVSRMIGTPPELAANMLLTLVAGLVAKNCRIAYHEDYIVPLNLWTVTLLDAGAGKTPVLKKILEPFEGTEIRDIIYDDVALTQLPLFLNKSSENGIIMSAEMTFFYNILNSNADVSLLLNSFDGEAKRIERKNCSMVLRQPKTSIGLAFQPKVLNRVKSYKRFELMRENGLFDRFLFSQPASGGAEASNELPIDHEVKYLYQKRMRRLTEIQDYNGTIIFNLTDRQRQQIVNFEREQQPMLQEGGKYAEIDTFCRKVEGKILRIAGILHVMGLTECDVPLLGELDVKIVPDKCIDFAIRLVAYYREEMLKVFGEIDDSHLEPARKLLKRIIANNRESFTHRDIQQQVRFTSGLKTPEELDATLHILESYGYIKLMENTLQTRGKKSIMIEVHPDIIQRPVLRAV